MNGITMFLMNAGIVPIPPVPEYVAPPIIELISQAEVLEIVAEMQKSVKAKCECDKASGVYCRRCNAARHIKQSREWKKTAKNIRVEDYKAWRESMIAAYG